MFCPRARAASVSSAQRPQESTLPGSFSNISRDRTDLIELLEATGVQAA
jgi:hypothetical protein